MIRRTEAAPLVGVVIFLAIALACLIMWMVVK